MVVTGVSWIGMYSLVAMKESMNRPDSAKCGSKGVALERRLFRVRVWYFYLFAEELARGAAHACDASVLLQRAATCWMRGLFEAKHQDFAEDMPRWHASTHAKCPWKALRH